MNLPYGNRVGKVEEIDDELVVGEKTETLFEREPASAISRANVQAAVTLARCFFGSSHDHRCCCRARRFPGTVRIPGCFFRHNYIFWRDSV